MVIREWTPPYRSAVSSRDPSRTNSSNILDAEIHAVAVGPERVGEVLKDVQELGKKWRAKSRIQF